MVRDQVDGHSDGQVVLENVIVQVQPLQVKLHQALCDFIYTFGTATSSTVPKRHIIGNLHNQFMALLTWMYTFMVARLFHDSAGSHLVKQRVADL